MSMKFKMLMASLLALFAVASHAFPATAYYAPITRVKVGSLWIDNWVVWQKQSDGTGVNLQWTGPSVVQGCDSAHFGTDGLKFYNSQVQIYDGNTGNLITSVYWPNTNSCTPTWDINRNGYDEGFVTVAVRTVASTNGADEWVEWSWDLYPSGNSVLRYAGWTYY